MEYTNLTMNENAESTNMKHMRIKKAVYIATICLLVFSQTPHSEYTFLYVIF